MQFLQKIEELPSSSEIPPMPKEDWLIKPSSIPTKIFHGKSDSEIILTNGLISRRFLILPNCATVGFVNQVLNQNIIRGVKPEAEIEINNKNYEIGGLEGQKEYAYFLDDWIPNLKKKEDSFELIDFYHNPIKKRFEWKQVRYAQNRQWPPAGEELVFKYIHRDLSDLEVYVHYEMYDGIPLLSKWVEVKNMSKNTYRINTISTEVLALVETESNPQGNMEYELPNVYFESDYTFSAMNPKAGNKTIRFYPDPQYSSQVDYLSQNPVLMKSRPPIGPEIDLLPGDCFESFRTYELIHDSWDRERKSLAQRKMYRIIAPWATENPIMMHCTTADPKIVKEIIDQCVEVGFEMVILSFGSGLNMEWDDPEFYEEYRELFDYAHSKGIEIGTYSLFSSRTVSPDADVIDPETEMPSKKAFFGHAPCLCSEWGIQYLQKIKNFIKETNCNLLEHDGPYPGDLCASKSHPGHRDLKDSQWQQWRASILFYRYCRAEGIYVNAPDWYFLNGTNKTGIGYKEVNWSLPRERQVIIARQNIFDGTWEKTPSMGWMFTPLTVYHMVGEWKESTLEPLSEHLENYEKHLFQNFSSGVQSCYRGRRLYDCEETKKIVKKWVNFYKTYREILDSDIIHLRRPDGQHIDGILHVNPQGKIKGLAVFYNPTRDVLSEEFKLPLYYTGLTDIAFISHEGKEPAKYVLDRMGNIILNLEIPANGFTWYLIS